MGGRVHTEEAWMTGREGAVRRAATRVALVLQVVASLVVLTERPGRAAATEILADWRMDEPPGAAVMVDASGNGLDGTVGSAVRTGVVVEDATVYRWPYTKPNQPPPKPERLVQVDDDRLNPGKLEFAITIRFRTTHSFGNIIQKGQSGSSGGYFKMQIPKGKLVCVFRGIVDGELVSKSVSSGDILLNDGAWHVVRCERTESGLTLTIDGSKTRRAWGWTGSISNDRPLTIGGKLDCDQVTITCDYFSGDIDYVRIETSPRPGLPFVDDFSQGFTAWDVVRNVSLDETTGGAMPPSAMVDVAEGSAYLSRSLGATYDFLCVSASVQVTTTGGNALVRLRTASNDPIARLLVDSSRYLRVRSDVSGVASPRTVLLDQDWHRLEVCGNVGATSTWDLYFDGRPVLQGWTADTGSQPIGTLELGDKGIKTWTAHLDDIVVDQGVGG
jgi:hypothetical protein